MFGQILSVRMNGINRVDTGVALMLAGITSILLYFISGLAISLSSKPKGFVQLGTTTLIAFAAMILLGGYATSELDQLGNVNAWLLCSFVCFNVSLLVAKFSGINPKIQLGEIFKGVAQKAVQFRIAHRNKDFIARFCGALLIAFVLIQLAQIASCLVPTSHYDSLSYIMPRMAQYVQQNNLDFYQSNFIAQTVHFKNATILQIYAFLSTGHNESWVQIVSFASSILATFSVFGIARIVWKNELAALASVLIFSMFANNLLIAVTPQLDMPITGMIGAATYFLVCFFEERNLKWLPWACLAAAIAFGIKASALLLAPSLGLIGLFCLWRVYQADGFRKAGAGLALGSASMVVCAIIFMLPAGYVENHLRHSHLMGPEDWRKYHELSDLTLEERLSVGTANMGRYAVHFISFEGLPEQFNYVQLALRKPILWMLDTVGIDVHSTEHVRQPFGFEDFAMLSPDGSYWGPATLLFVLPAVVVGLVRYRKQRLVIALTIAGGFYFIAQSYSSQYDPWRGRSFANLGIFLSPLIGCLFLEQIGQLRLSFNRNSRVLLSVAATLVLISAATVTVKRAKHTTRGWQNSDDRVGFISRKLPSYTDRFRKYESLVPPGSTVWLSPRTSSEQHYLIYGEKLNRRIVFNKAAAEGKTIDFKVFASKFEKPLPTDIPLDEEDSPSYDGRWYLRRLNTDRLASGNRSDANRSTENR